MKNRYKRLSMCDAVCIIIPYDFIRRVVSLIKTTFANWFYFRFQKTGGRKKNDSFGPLGRASPKLRLSTERPHQPPEDGNKTNFRNAVVLINKNHVTDQFLNRHNE
jgi:hypothetical protein